MLKFFSTEKLKCSWSRRPWWQQLQPNIAENMLLWSFQNSPCNVGCNFFVSRIFISSFTVFIKSVNFAFYVILIATGYISLGLYF